MSTPLHVSGYNSEWISVAQRIANGELVAIPLNNVKSAQRMRLRFYGFRRALLNQEEGVVKDKNYQPNPLLLPLMETQVTITPDGTLVFERDRDGEILRAALKLPQPPRPTFDNAVGRDEQPRGPSMPEHEKIFENLGALFKREAEKIDQELPKATMDDTLTKLGFGTKKE